MLLVSQLKKHMKIYLFEKQRNMFWFGLDGLNHQSLTFWQQAVWQALLSTAVTWSLYYRKTSLVERQEGNRKQLFKDPGIKS